jgi:hypothetical protein
MFRENNIEKLNSALHEYQTLNRLLMELADLNYDFLLWLRDYCEAEKIPLWKKPQFTNLCEASERLFKKLDEPLTRLKALFPSDEFLQHKKSDEDFTEPGFLYLNYGSCIDAELSSFFIVANK